MIEFQNTLARFRSYLPAPVRRFVDRVLRAVREELEHRAPASDDAAVVERANALARVDLSAHNANGHPPTFSAVTSQAVSALQFSEADFERIHRTMFPGVTRVPWGDTHATIDVPHRKLWEFCYVVRAAEQTGRLESGRRALGFGVGQEPIPAMLARFGMSVLATDLDTAADQAAGWAASEQHMSGVAALARPELVPNEDLERLVRTAFVDMNSIPDGLGTFDLIWSSCALEHLGSPEAGLDFVARTLDLLEPGGVSVHTTELELTAREETADYGHMAVYRIVDLERLAERVRSLGFEMVTNWYVSMDTPADRWIALPPYPQDDPAHLKLTIGRESVSTSVGLLIRRPDPSPSPRPPPATR